MVELLSFSIDNYYTKTEADNKYIIKGSEGFITEEELNNKLQTDLGNYYTKTEADDRYTSKNADSLNVVHDDRLLKITGDPESNKFNVDIVTSSTSSPTTMNIMQIGLGKVDFGYNQIRTQHLVLAEQSLQQIIRSDMSQRPKSTDVSLYIALMIDNNFYNKSEIDTKISEVKNELPEDVDLSTCIKTTGPQTISSTDISQPVLHLVSQSMMLGDDGPLFKYTTEHSYFQIYYQSYALYLEDQTSTGLCFTNRNAYLSRNRSSPSEGEQIICKNDLANYVLKTEIPDLTSSYTKTECDKKFIINDYENELSFTDGETISSKRLSCVCYGNGMFVTVSNNGKVAWSTDGKTFTYGGIISNVDWSGICYGNDMFVIVSYNSICAWSTDGKTFTNGTISYDGQLTVKHLLMEQLVMVHGLVFVMEIECSLLLVIVVSAHGRNMELLQQKVFH